MRVFFRLLFWLCLSYITGSIFVCTPSVAATRPHILTVTFFGPAGGTQMASLTHFATLIEQRSKGELTIRITASPSPTPEPGIQAVRALQQGDIACALLPSLAYNALDARFGVISLPFLYDDVDQADAVLAGGAGATLKEIARSYGITILAFGEHGMRQLTSQKPITTPNSLQGVHLRLPAVPMYKRFLSDLGAQAETTSFTGLSSALQHGIFTAQENSLETIDAFGLIKNQRYLTLWNYSYEAFFFGINEAYFATLPQHLQIIIRQSAKEACDMQKRLVREHNATFIQKSIAKGIHIKQMDHSIKSTFKQKAKPTWAEAERELGKAFIARFRR